MPGRNPPLTELIGTLTLSSIGAGAGALTASSGGGLAALIFENLIIESS